jgi:hypothetical protein
MIADASQQDQNRWRDAEGNPVSVFCWIEQVAEDPRQGALFSRLRQRGEVVGKGPDLLYVRFAGEGQVIGVPPHLVRVLDTAPDQR